MADKSRSEKVRAAIENKTFVPGAFKLGGAAARAISGRGAKAKSPGWIGRGVDALTGPARLGAALAKNVKSKRDLERARERAARGERANPEANRRAKERYAKHKAAKKAKADAAEKPKPLGPSPSGRPYSPVVNTGPRAKTPATKPVRPTSSATRGRVKRPTGKAEIPDRVKGRMKSKMGYGQ